MTKLTIAAFIGVVAFGGTMLGQDQTSQQTPEQQRREEIIERLRARGLMPTPESREAAARLEEERRLKLTALAGLNECALPNGATYPVQTTVTYLGWRYQCVEVLDASLSRSGVGWTRLRD